jgi:hypothetical protein
MARPSSFIASFCLFASAAFVMGASAAPSSEASAPRQATFSAIASASDDATPLSCSQDAARKDCCPAYCAGKKGAGGWKAAEERFFKCVVGYGCTSSDVHTGQCEAWHCKD